MTEQIHASELAELPRVSTSLCMCVMYVSGKCF